MQAGSARAWVIGAIAVVALTAAVGLVAMRRRTPAAPPGPPVARVATPAQQAALTEFGKLYEQKEFEKAITSARLYLEHEPDAPYLHYSIATALGAMKDYPGAIAELEQEIKLNPAYSKSYGAIAFGWIQRGDLNQALPFFEKAASLAPDDPNVATSLGALLNRLGRPQEAEAHLRRAARSPAAVGAHYELGTIELKEGRYPEAIAEFRQVLARDKEHAGAMYNLGQALLRQGRKAEAEQVLARHAEFAAEEQTLQPWIQFTEQPQRTAEDFANLGEAYVRFERYPLALPAYRWAVRLDPSKPRYAQGLASVLLELGQLDEADRYAAQVLEQVPDNPASLFLRGVVRIRQGRVEEGEQILARSQQLGQWTAQTNRQLADAYVAAHRYPDALAALDRALALEPGHARTYHARGQVLGRMERWADARAAHEQAVRLDPGRDDHWMAYAIACFITADRGTAETAFRRALELQRVKIFGEENVARMIEDFHLGPATEPALAHYLDLWRQDAAAAVGQPTPEATGARQ